MRRFSVRLDLPAQILIGLAAGAFLGALGNLFGWGPWILTYVKPLGTLFVRLISLVVVPLVLASLVVGAASLGDPRKLGRVGAKTVAYYLLTTAFSVGLGLALANTVRPGAGLPETVKNQLLASYSGELGTKLSGVPQRENLLQTLLGIVTTNPVQSL
ncbi:MAG: dicarboxylate/amino acid:cation symporter, partial [candidate division KSB1 bacterium]|nr:dicarboxylate/amino acid:cation symporter [candidate division KSB1 bacterium]